ncbi:MAG TPA: amino acid permease [Caulobacteraceae bacterium]|jgi:APA family basic amino acid/polyamine antiporter
MANVSIVARMFQRKSVELIHAETDHSELKRTLGALNLVLLGIGCIIGTGIFVLTGHAAAEWAGPGIMISFVITGILCGLVALCYAELASALPVSGSAYSYSYASTGEIVAWIMGVLLLLEYGLAAATVAVGWSGYLISLLADLHIHLPVALQAAAGSPVKDPITGAVIGTGVVNLPAVLGIAAVTTLLIVGVSESATVNNIIVVIKLTVVIAFIGIGAFYVHPALWSPLIPAQVPAPPPGTPMDMGHQILSALGDIVTGKKSSQYGVGGVIHGAAVIFFAYIGFEAVSTAGAESKNPSRDMPIGILGSLLVCTILYIATCAVLVGIVPYAQLDGPAPIAYAVNKIGITWFAELVKLGAICGLSSVMLVLLYGQTRIFYTMSHDGLLPSQLAAVHKRFKTPWINTIIVGLVAAACAGFLSLDTLSDVTNVGTLAAFTIVCGTVIYLRVTHPNMPRPFRAPLYPVVPILGAIMCIVLLLSLIMGVEKTRNFFLVYVGVGFLVYFVFGLWNSKLSKGNLMQAEVAAMGTHPPAE